MHFDRKTAQWTPLEPVVGAGKAVVDPQNDHGAQTTAGLQDPHWTVRRAAVQAFGKLPIGLQEDRMPAIANCLADASKLVRQVAVATVGKWTQAVQCTALPLVLDLLIDERREVSQTAAEALGRMATAVQQDSSVAGLFVHTVAGTRESAARMLNAGGDSSFTWLHYTCIQVRVHVLLALWMQYYNVMGHPR